MERREKFEAVLIPVALALLGAALLANCDAAPLAEPTDTPTAIAAPTPVQAAPTAEPVYCTLDPGTLVTPVRVVAVRQPSDADDQCARYTQALTQNPLTLDHGTLCGFPVRITGLRAHDSRDPTVTCVYEVAGTLEYVTAPNCTIGVDIVATVEVR